jgi:hypothetical protein
MATSKFPEKPKSRPSSKSPSNDSYQLPEELPSGGTFRWGASIGEELREKVPGDIAEKLKEGHLPADIFFAACHSVLEDFFSKAKQKSTLSCDAPHNLAEAILSNVLEDENRSLESLAPEANQSLHTYLFSHIRPGTTLEEQCIATTIVAIILALGLRLGKEALVTVAKASLLHKIGLVLLPEHVWTVPGPLSSEQRSIIARYPALGAEFLERTGQGLDKVAYIVHQHHERLDGSGYPKGLRGDEIDLLAYIVGLAEIFEAMTARRPYRGAIAPTDAVRHILEREKKAFPIDLIKQVLVQIGFFPVGSQVRLSNGEIARVIKANPDHPLRPTVQILLTRDRRKPHHPTIKNLREEPLIFIRGPIIEESRQDISNIY